MKYSGGLWWCVVVGGMKNVPKKIISGVYTQHRREIMGKLNFIVTL